jgi:hypothetical protein
LLRNHIGGRKPWLGLRLVGEKGKRDMLGARVAAHIQGGRTLWRHVHTDGSYASGRDPRVLFGLGQHQSVAMVGVRWPDGRMEQWENPATRKYTTLTQGTGKAVK